MNGKPQELQDAYFMEIASLTAKHSNDKKTKVGACIVDKNKAIVGTGYNHMPKGEDGKYPWEDPKDDKLNNKHSYVCHAELNAIMKRTCLSLDDCIIYVTLHPCNECSKLIIQSGIKEVVYMDDKHADKDYTETSKRMLKIAKIISRQYVPKISDCEETECTKAKIQRKN